MTEISNENTPSYHDDLEGLNLALGMIAHDMRNSIQVIVGNVGLIGLLSQEDRTQEIIQRINRQVEYLSVMVDDFLIIGNPNPSRSYADMGSNQQVTGEEILRIAEEMSKKSAESLQVSCTFEGTATEKGLDTTFAYRLVRIIANLLNNALAAVAGEGKVSLRLDFSGDNLHLSIDDTGQGIDFKPENQDDILKSFQQRGMGLGIVSSLVNLMEGEIVWRSQPSSRVTVKVPIVYP